MVGQNAIVFFDAADAIYEASGGILRRKIYVPKNIELDILQKEVVKLFDAAKAIYVNLDELLVVTLPEVNAEGEAVAPINIYRFFNDKLILTETPSKVFILQVILSKKPPRDVKQVRTSPFTSEVLGFHSDLGDALIVRTCPANRVNEHPKYKFHFAQFYTFDEEDIKEGKAWPSIIYYGAI